MSTWSLTYLQSVLKHYHSDRHLSEFYLQDGGKNQLAQTWNKITSPSPICIINLSLTVIIVCSNWHPTSFVSFHIDRSFGNRNSGAASCSNVPHKGVLLCVTRAYNRWHFSRLSRSRCWLTVHQYRSSQPGSTWASTRSLPITGQLQ